MFHCTFPGCDKSYAIKSSLRSHKTSKHSIISVVNNFEEPIILNDNVIIENSNGNSIAKFDELIKDCEKYMEVNSVSNLCTNEIFKRGFQAPSIIFELQSYLQSEVYTKTILCNERKNKCIDNISKLSDMEQFHINSRKFKNYESLKNIKLFIETDLDYVNYLLDINVPAFKSVKHLLMIVNGMTHQQSDDSLYAPAITKSANDLIVNTSKIMESHLLKQSRLKLFKYFVIFISVVIIGISFWFRKNLKEIVVAFLKK